MSERRVLFASSEVYPFAKSGGLADVAHALPRTLNKSTHIDVVMPLYQFISRERFNIVDLRRTFEIEMGDINYSISLYGCYYEGVNYLFIDSPLLCEREFLYGTPEAGYDDNAMRFGIFNYAIIALLQEQSYDIVHLNDWQCGLVALLLQEKPELRVKSAFTIHNLAYQGTFDAHFLKALGINEKYFSLEGIEFYGLLSFMKAGIAYADAVTTVSKQYAKEILSSEFGCGLEGFLYQHRHKLHGIINGLDSEHFSPANDKALMLPYNNMSDKLVNKKAYLKEVQLKGAQKPLFIFIGRFTWQKGMELLISGLETMATHSCNIAILGEGEAQYHEALKQLSSKHENIYLEFGYDESLSHRMYAAADFLLMPSLFEPCGLNQMIAMAYGAMPIVHHVGGLVDTVNALKNFKTGSQQAYGIIFKKPEARAFNKAINSALALYATKREFNKIVKHNMQCDFSWSNSAREYVRLYEKIEEKSI